MTSAQWHVFPTESNLDPGPMEAVALWLSTRWDDVERLVWRYVTLKQRSIQSILRSSQATLSQFLANICKHILKPVPWQCYLYPQISMVFETLAIVHATFAPGSKHGYYSPSGDEQQLRPQVFRSADCESCLGDVTSAKRQAKTALHSLNFPSTAGWWQITCSTMSCLLHYEIISYHIVIESRIISIHI